MQKMLSPSKYAEKYSCHVDTVRGWCRNGKLEANYYKDEKGHWQISEDTLPPKSYRKRLQNKEE